MSVGTTAELLEAFLDNSLDPAGFKHRDHVAVAFEMLRQYDFLDASAKYAGCLRALTEKAGVPEKFNATVTMAFMSLIAERMNVAEYRDFEDFEAANGDLASIAVLNRWYSKDRMSSEAARKIFLLPDRAA